MARCGRQAQRRLPRAIVANGSFCQLTVTQTNPHGLGRIAPQPPIDIILLETSSALRAYHHEALPPEVGYIPKRYVCHCLLPKNPPLRTVGHCLERLQLEHTQGKQCEARKNELLSFCMQRHPQSIRLWIRFSPSNY